MASIPLTDQEIKKEHPGMFIPAGVWDAQRKKEQEEYDKTMREIDEDFKKNPELLSDQELHPYFYGKVSPERLKEIEELRNSHPYPDMTKECEEYYKWLEAPKCKGEIGKNCIGIKCQKRHQVVNPDVWDISKTDTLEQPDTISSIERDIIAKGLDIRADTKEIVRNY